MAKRVIFSRFITLRNGKRLDARACGRHAFRFVVDDDDNDDIAASAANSDTELALQEGVSPDRNVGNDDDEKT